MRTTIKSWKQKVYNFFEKPDNVWAYVVQGLIIILIFVSVGITVAEFFYHDIFKRYEFELHAINLVVLGAFTVEYVLRLISSPHRLEFVKRPRNIVDFLAIAPHYVELLLPFFIPTEEIRVIRLLRLTRLIRALKVFEYKRVITKVFVLQDTILEVIFPVILFFAAIKGVIWILELNHWWFVAPDLTNLLGTFGGALGIIIAQKIATSYDKFLSIDETILRMYGNLRSIIVVLDRKAPKLGTNATSEWVGRFLKVLEDPRSNNSMIHEADEKLYAEIAKVEKEPGEVTAIYNDVVGSAAYVLSKKTRIIPRVYDVLLHQAIVIYILLLTIALSGIVGFVAVVVATGLLYGMYELTEDLDSILGGKHNLININLSELKSLTQV